MLPMALSVDGCHCEMDHVVGLAHEGFPDLECLAGRVDGLEILLLMQPLQECPLRDSQRFTVLPSQLLCHCESR